MNVVYIVTIEVEVPREERARILRRSGLRLAWRVESCRALVPADSVSPHNSAVEFARRYFASEGRACRFVDSCRRETGFPPIRV